MFRTHQDDSAGFLCLQSVEERLVGPIGATRSEDVSAASDQGPSCACGRQHDGRQVSGLQRSDRPVLESDVDALAVGKCRQRFNAFELLFRQRRPADIHVSSARSAQIPEDPCERLWFGNRIVVGKLIVLPSRGKAGYPNKRVVKPFTAHGESESFR